MQGNYPCAWFLEDLTQDFELRPIAMHMTSVNLEEEETGRYISSFQDGTFEWHVFDRGETP